MVLSRCLFLVFDLVASSSVEPVSLSDFEPLPSSGNEPLPSSGVKPMPYTLEFSRCLLWYRISAFFDVEPVLPSFFEPMPYTVAESVAPSCDWTLLPSSSSDTQIFSHDLTELRCLRVKKFLQNTVFISQVVCLGDVCTSDTFTTVVRQQLCFLVKKPVLRVQSQSYNYHFGSGSEIRIRYSTSTRRGEKCTQK
jgi:hypothetical protein